jgi:fructuronate reductase
MPVNRLKSTYPLGAVTSGIVHIGLGAFHRAHQAVYIERYLQRHGGGEWGIVSANIRSNVALVDQMNDAGNCYHVVEYADADNVDIRQVRAIKQAIFAGADRSELLAVMASPTTKIVTLTVTEKGYGIEPASGELNRNDGAVLADIDDISGARSVPGLLVTALSFRRQQGLGGFTILSCDNMPHNGKRVQRAVMAMAKSRNAALAEWIANNVSFPSSMVDRIVPAVTGAALQKLIASFGLNDVNAIETERFSQWVVEDNFCAGRPALEEVGVEFVDDVGAYETMKLRLLNGSHSLLAYCGQILGLTTVDEAVLHPVLRKLVMAFMDETKPSVHVDIDIDAYAASLLDRFGNQTLNHRLAQIATDGSQKIPQRWLAHMQEAAAEGRVLPYTELALSAWMVYMVGQRFDGVSFPVNDPLQTKITACRNGNDVVQTVTNILSLDEIFNSSWRQDDALIARLTSNCQQLLDSKDVATVTALFT